MFIQKLPDTPIRVNGNDVGIEELSEFYLNAEYLISIQRRESGLRKSSDVFWFFDNFTLTLDESDGLLKFLKQNHYFN